MAHNGGNHYYNIVLDVTGYERTAYNGFDLVRMNVAIENLADFDMSGPVFRLGGAAQYVNDPLDNPDTDTKSWYEHATYADVRARGGDVSIEECASADRFSKIPQAGTGKTSMCFIIGKAFDPDGLMVEFEYEGDHVKGGYDASDPSACDAYDHSSHSCPNYIQVIPFHDQSISCFDLQFDWCNTNNIQPIDGAATQTPEPPSHATLLHTTYYNHTGTLVLAFDRAVIPGNPDRIYLIHDVDTFLGNGTAPDLGDSELYTVDGKRQSVILAFALDDALRATVTESLREIGYLSVLIDTRAIYAAEDFTDITKKDGTQILVPDVVVVR